MARNSSSVHNILTKYIEIYDNYIATNKDLIYKLFKLLYSKQ